MRALVVEDESGVRETLKKQLTNAAFGVDVAADGAEGLFAGLNYPLDIAIVDLGLPRRGGLDVIREWRAHKRTFPVLILTARNGWDDRLEGLLAGADDYVGKPFSYQEVLARVQILVRRTHGWAHPELECGPYVLDTNLRTLKVSGMPVELTSFEYRLLEHLMLRTGQTLSGKDLMEHMYEEEADRESNIVPQLVRRLRRKLDPEDRFQPIENVYGDGYRFTIARGAAGETTLRRPKERS